MSEINKKKEILRAVYLILSAVIILGFLVTIALFAFGGGEVEFFFTKTAFYYGIGILSVLGLVAMSIWRVTTNNENIISYIFQYEEAVLPSFFRFHKSLFWTMILFVNFTLLFGMIGAISNQFLLSTPQTTKQQILPTGKMILETEPASFSEQTLLAGILASLVATAVSILIGNKATSKVLNLFVVPLTVMLFGIAEHLLVYGGQETKLQFTAIFWLVSGIITVATGSFVGGYLAHFGNNFYAEANRLFSNDAIFIGTFVFFILFNGLMFLFRSILKKKKSVQEAIS